MLSKIKMRFGKFIVPDRDYRALVLENWGIKLFSLVMTLTLWFYVTSKGKAEMALTVPLELRNIPKKMAVVGNVTKNLEVRVQGQERVLRNITVGKQVSGILDLSSSRAGENTIRISPEDINRPAGVSVTYFSPYEIKVRLEPIVQKRAILIPRTQGRPAAGYVFTGAKSMPAMILLEGPQGVMQALTTIRTMPIDIEGLREPVSVTPKIDYQGRPITIVEKDISVTVTIRKRRGRK